jgi:PBSX family phage terminase large subunit
MEILTNMENTPIVFENTITVTMPREFLPPQLEVLQAIYENVGVLYSGAFRAGKTLLLVHAAIIVCLENPGVRAVLGSQTHGTVYKTIFAFFKEELARYQQELYDKGIDLNLTKRIRSTAGSMEWESYNGSIIYFSSCDDERKFASMTLDFFGLDEPIDIAESVFTQLIGRISGTKNLKNPFGLLTTNPGSELHWIYEYFINESTKQDDFYFVTTTTFDNKLLPNYDRYIARNESIMDEDWKRRYLNGMWGMFEGQVYKTFNPRKQVGDFFEHPVSYHICGVDWGVSTPHCILVMGVTQSNKLIVKQEYYGKEVTTERLSKQIANLHKEYRFRKVFVDPSAADLILQLTDRGVPAEGGYNDVENGIAKVNSILASGNIHVDENCRNLILEMQAYRYKPDTEIPIKENDHSPDALRYGVTDYSPYIEEAGFGCGWWGRRRKR